MNTEHEDLSELLRSWKTSELNAVEIRRSVWHSIEGSRSNAFQAFMEIMLAWIGRPAISAAILILSMVAGFTYGGVASIQAQTGMYLSALMSFLP